MRQKASAARAETAHLCEQLVNSCFQTGLYRRAVTFWQQFFGTQPLMPRGEGAHELFPCQVSP